MVELVKKMFLDPSRCIGCRSCVAACRECDTHKGGSMIYIDYLERRRRRLKKKLALRVNKFVLVQPGEVR